MKKATFLRFLPVLALVLFIPSLTLASELRQGEFVKVPAGEIIEGNLYTAATDINIEGEITGDLICAAAKLNVKGKVGGDIICAASESDISGEVAGSVRIVGSTTNISGLVAKNVFSLGQNISLTDKSRLGQDLVVAGDKAEVYGQIGGDIWGALSKLDIKGQVGKNLRLKLDDQMTKDKAALTIAPEAKIGGDISYAGFSQADYKTESVNGQVTHNTPEKKQLGFMAWLQKHLYKIFSALLVALLLSLWLKNSLVAVAEDVSKNFWTTFWPGILLMFMPPLVFIFLLITIIGIPLSLIMLALWIPALYVAQVLTAIIIGQTLITRFKVNKEYNNTLAIIGGVLITWLLYAIPFIGFFVGFAACAIGLGVMWRYVKKYYQAK